MKFRNNWHTNNYILPLIATVALIGFVVASKNAGDTWHSHLSDNGFLLLLLVINVWLWPFNARRLEEQYRPFPLVDDVFSKLKMEQPLLLIADHPLDPQSIKHVALDKINDQHALLSLPANLGGKVGLMFPATQLDAVRDFVRQHLRHARVTR